MKSNLHQEDIERFYKGITCNNPEAFEFITLWSRYIHMFDDLVDEKSSILDRIETNNELIKLMNCDFYKQHHQRLLPQIYLIAESYLASETSQKDTALGGFLSHEANNMLRLVALICGGWDHLKFISEDIRHLTYIEHPVEDVPINFHNLPQKD